MAEISPFCEWSHVTARLSVEGGRLATDDDPAVQSEVLSEATYEVLEYTLLHYSPEALAASVWVRHKTRDVAVYLARTRRGNPAPKSIQARYDKAIESLRRVQQGTLVIPDAPVRKENVPVLSNQRVQMWPFPRVVTVTGTSTGTPEGFSQHVDSTDFFDYSI